MKVKERIVARIAPGDRCVLAACNFDFIIEWDETKTHVIVRQVPKETL